MGLEIAAESGSPLPRSRLKLPRRVPDFGPRGFFLFKPLWFAAFALALLGPVASTRQRVADDIRSSGLVTGSRAGVTLTEENFSRIRFPVRACLAALLPFPAPAFASPGQPLTGRTTWCAKTR
ncbi:MAG: hypothetical protein QOG72_1159 [Sphingomonadales bacterium]|jgi:hypothetical protein|nr:hypothetical protein [Sphingomonadales bacterium]